MRIDGKVVLITGASDGIGAACAREFAKRGARLSLTARSEDKLNTVAAGADALVTAGDLTDSEVRRQVVDRTIERFGSIDILINNAGVGMYSPAWKAPLDEAHAMFELNFFAPLAMIQLVVPHMRGRGGMVVNMGSIAGKVPLPWFTLYSATKFALGSLTEGLRMELAGDGIRTMVVCPGYVSTSFQSHALVGQAPDRLLKGKRFAITAEQCAAAVAGGVERDARTVVTPAIGWALVVAQRLFPSIVEAQMQKIYQGHTK